MNAHWGIDDPATAGALVQIVDILGHEGQFRHEVGQLREREMSRVRFRFGHEVSTPAVPAPDEDRVGQEGLGPAPLQLVASPAYLERYGEPAQARDLPGYDLLADDVSRGPVRWALTRGGALTVQPALRCNDHALLTEAALHDVGIALLPMTSVQSHLQDGTLRAVLEGIVGSRRDIHIVYPRKIRRSGALSAFVTFALDYINTHGKLLGITSSSKSPEPDRTSGS